VQLEAVPPPPRVALRKAPGLDPARAVRVMAECGVRDAVFSSQLVRRILPPSIEGAGTSGSGGGGWYCLQMWD